MNPGIEFEQQVGCIFEAAGCDVEFTKQSRDKGVDLLVTFEGSRLAVQCKYYNRPVGLKAVQEVFTGAEFYHASRGCVVTSSDFTYDAQTLAKQIGVILINGLLLQDVELNPDCLSETLIQGFAQEPVVFTLSDIAKRYGLTTKQVIKYIIPQGLPLFVDKSNQSHGLWADLVDWEQEKKYVFVGPLLERKIVFSELKAEQ